MAAVNLPKFPVPENAAVIARFVEYLTVKGLSSRTIEAYRCDLAQFLSSLNDQSILIGAGRDDVRKYLACCLDRGLNPATVARKISTLREFFKHLLRDGLIEHDPMLRIETVKQWKRVPKAISEAEVRQLLDNFGNPQSPRALRDCAMLETLYAGGLRIDELVSAKLTDLNLQQRCLSVIGKGSKQRLVPLGVPAAFALRRYLAAGRPLLTRKESPFLFVGSRGRQQLTRARVWQIVKRLGRQFDLPGLSPHVFRHSCATHLLDHRADLRTIQTILGHAEISTTQLYTKVSQEHLREIMGRCHPRNNPKRLQTRLFDGFVSDMLPGPSPYRFSASMANSNPCIDCANPSVEGKARCEVHLARAREAGKRHYSKRRQDGICVECRDPAVGNSPHCEVHARRAREARKRRLT